MDWASAIAREMVVLGPIPVAGTAGDVPLVTTNDVPSLPSTADDDDDGAPFDADNGFDDTTSVDWSHG